MVQRITAQQVLDSKALLFGDKTLTLFGEKGCTAHEIATRRDGDWLFVDDCLRLRVLLLFVNSSSMKEFMYTLAERAFVESRFSIDLVNRTLSLMREEKITKEDVDKISYRASTTPEADFNYMLLTVKYAAESVLDDNLFNVCPRFDACFFACKAAYRSAIWAYASKLGADINDIKARQYGAAAFDREQSWQITELVKLFES